MSELIKIVMINGHEIAADVIFHCVAYNLGGV